MVDTRISCTKIESDISHTRVHICNLRSLGGCPLRVSRICPHSPMRGSVVLYRVSQGPTLHWLEAGLVAHLSTFADRPSLRSLAGHRHRVSSRASPLRRDTTSTQASNKVPSGSMACMMTTRRRASATRAFRSPRRFAILSAQLFSAKLWRVRVKIELAAS